MRCNMTKTITDIQQKYGALIAQKAFETGAIQLSVQKPFTWASGYKMPIYNDNRRLLSIPDARKLICQAFNEMLIALEYKPSWIAGVATGGIPHATSLADSLQLPLAYIRSASKDHGLKNQIEGLGSQASFEHKPVLVIEDLISTGGSSIKAIEAVREQNGLVPFCFAIFSYGFDTALTAFQTADCKAYSILDYTTMLETAVKQNYIDSEQMSVLQTWRSDPFGWYTQD